MPGMEHLPAALAGGRLLRPARRIGAPVDGGEIDVDAEPLEQVGRHFALALGDRNVLRAKERDGVADVLAAPTVVGVPVEGVIT